MQHGEVSHGVKKKKRMRVRWKERRGNKVVQCEAQSWPSAASIFMSITSSSQHHVSESLGHFHFPRRVTNVIHSPENNIVNYRKQQRQYVCPCSTTTRYCTSWTDRPATRWDLRTLPCYPQRTLGYKHFLRWEPRGSLSHYRTLRCEKTDQSAPIDVIEGKKIAHSILGRTRGRRL